MKNSIIVYLALVLTGFTACNDGKKNYDASGTFEAIETLISAEANGQILKFDIREGQDLKAGETIGYIDSTQLHLQKLRLEQNKRAVLSGKPQTQVQIKALKEQLATARTNRDRIANLVDGGVANQKQLDDANSQVSTLEAQISAQLSTLNTTNISIDEQGNVIDVQLQEVKDRLEKCRITNPIEGTVLSKYAEPFEMASMGRPLYKIANLNNIILRAYITADQFANIKLNQNVKVLTDNDKGGFNETTGTVSWISDQAEFTPKSILTKNERANLVYAIKVIVPNDGTYKIGMYGQIKFQ